MELAHFFNYNEEGKTDYGYEAMQDFFLSWTIRCSDKKYEKIDPKVHNYAKKIVQALLYGTSKNEGEIIVNKKINDFTVSEVKTRRQEGYIDLIAEIKVEEKSIEKTYILNIENKWYSNIRDGQLKKSKDYIEKNYSAKKYKILHLIIFCDYEKLKNKKVREECKKEGYRYLTIEDLQEFSGILKKEETSNLEKRKTGNYLFDEYWYRKMG